MPSLRALAPLLVIFLVCLEQPAHAQGSTTEALSTPQSSEPPAATPTAPATVAPAISPPTPAPASAAALTPPPATPSAPPPQAPYGYTPPSTAGYTYVPPVQGLSAPNAAGSASPVPLAPPQSPAERERATNTHVDRGILMPTAETQPKGTLYFSSYEIVLLQAGYAVGNDTQISFTLTPPVGKDDVLPLDISLKSVVLREPKVRLAAFGSASGILGLKEGAAFVGRVGGAFQGCFNEACSSSVNVASTLLLIGPGLITANAVGSILKVSDTVDWLFEVDSLVPLGREAGIYNGIAAGTGVRLSGKHLGLDLTLVTPLDRKAKDLPVFPFLAGTYRENLLE